jgi:aspartate racemase
VDYVYQKEMQLTAVRAASTKGPINQLRTVMVTLDFNMLVANLQAGRKQAAEEQVAVTTDALRAAGADFIVVTSGTTSTLTGRARARGCVPFLDLAEAAWKEVSRAGPVGLLCTSYATAGGIFQASADSRGATLVLPSRSTAHRIDEVIFGELICGEVSETCLRVLQDAIAELVERGAVSIILGNTDMTLAADRLEQLTPAALIDSARAHARAAGRAAVEGHL